MKLVKYIAFGLAFVLVPEFTSIVVISGMQGAFIGALIIYAFLLAGSYVFQLVVDKLISRQLFANGLIILISGLFGLSIEWFLIGNSPWENPDAIQWGMFAYWVGLFMLPRILIDGRDQAVPLARRIKIAYLAYSLIHLAIAILLPVALLIFVIPLLWTIIYTGFFFAYFKYVSLPKSDSLNEDGRGGSSVTTTNQQSA